MTVRKWFYNLPIGLKLLAAILVTSLTVLWLSSCVFLVNDIHTYRELNIYDKRTIAEILGIGCMAALEFNDEAAAQKQLSSLRMRPHVTTAYLYKKDGSLLTGYVRPGEQFAPPLKLGPAGVHTLPHRLIIISPIKLKEETIGILYMESDFEEINERFRDYLTVIIASTFGSMLLAVFLSFLFQRLLTGPLLNLTDKAKDISIKKDYSIRAERQSGDELGHLTDAFNQMLSEIQRRDIEHQKSEERFRSVIEAAPNAMVMVDEAGTIQLVNKTAEDLFGYSREELLTMKVDALVPDRFRDKHPEHRRGFHADPQIRSMGMGRDLFGLRKDGREVPIEIGLNPIESDGKRFVLASIVDITERKRSQERFQTLVESAPNAMVMVDETGKIQLVNKSTEKLFGYSRQELIGMSVENLVPQEFRAQHPGHRQSFHQNLKAREMGTGRELFALRKDGRQVPVEIGLNPIETTEGKFVLASIVDISERKLTEERHRYIMEASLDAVVSIDAQGHLIEWSRQADTTFGWSRDEVLGKSLSEIIIPVTYREAHHKGLQRYLQTGKGSILNKRVELTALHRDGHEFPVEVSITPIQMQGQIIFSAFLRDISERKKMEARAEIAKQEIKKGIEDLKRSNEELEQLAYVASHDLQEPLRKIVGFTQLFSNKFSGKVDPESQEYINFIINGTKRMQTLIQDLLRFSRVGKQDMVSQEVSFETIVKEAVGNLEEQIKEKNAVIEYHDLPVVHVHQNLMVQVIQNLIGNALKYCQVTPLIRISAQQDKDEWIFSIQDNGIGIDKNFFENIFIIFQRLHSKSEYSGTGIGLAICKKIIERTGGRIWVESQPGQGSTFKFTVPFKKGGQGHG